LENRSTGGKGVVGGSAPNITDAWNTHWPARRADCDFVILQGGVNDIKSFAITLSALQAGFQALLDEAIADMGAARVFVWNIAPWGNHDAWTAPHQATTEAFNDWLADEAVTQGFVLIDMYALLGDPANPHLMAAAYDVGDGLHPSPAGATAQYQRMVTAFAENQTLNMVTRMNPIKLCAGAVEPSIFNAAPNQLKRWVGAVQPSYAAVRVTQGQTIGANFVINQPDYGLVLLDRALTEAEETIVSEHLSGLIV
jgi:lysophospholipase L1-like esterase